MLHAVAILSNGYNAKAAVIVVACNNRYQPFVFKGRALIIGIVIVLAFNLTNKMEKIMFLLLQKQLL